MKKRVTEVEIYTASDELIADLIKAIEWANSGRGMSAFEILGIIEAVKVYWCHSCEFHELKEEWINHEDA